jgi:hypothetical protein
VTAFTPENRWNELDQVRLVEQTVEGLQGEIYKDALL